jgi:hypothetical protein
MKLETFPNKLVDKCFRIYIWVMIVLSPVIGVLSWTAFTVNIWKVKSLGVILKLLISFFGGLVLGIVTAFGFFFLTTILFAVVAEIYKRYLKLRNKPSAT